MKKKKSRSFMAYAKMLTNTGIPKFWTEQYIETVALCLTYKTGLYSTETKKALTPLKNWSKDPLEMLLLNFKIYLKMRWGYSIRSELIRTVPIIGSLFGA